MLNINAVYIILKKQGLCLFAKTLEKDFPDPDLISPFLTAVETFAEQVIGDDIKSFKIESRNQITYCFRDFHEFSVVISLDNLHEQIEPLLEKVGVAFMIEHGENLRPWKGSVKPFQKFETTLENLLEEFGVRKDMWKVIFPIHTLDALTLPKLPEDKYQVATTLLTIREGTLKDIVEEMELKKPIKAETLDAISRTLDYLVEEGFCGYNHHSESYFIR